MLDSRLLDILRCPDTRQSLVLASAQQLSELNQKIAHGLLRNQAGRTLSMPLEAALVCQDGSRIYPVVDGIPVMLLDESISAVS